MLFIYLVDHHFVFSCASHLFSNFISTYDSPKENKRTQQDE